MTTNEKRKSLTEKPASDNISIMVRTAVSAIPWAGGPLALILSEYLPNELEKRKTEFLLELDDEMERLKEKINKDVITRDIFTSVFLATFRKAIETHQKEKLDAYRAIILNTITQTDPDDDEITIYLNLTERMTPLHIKLLKIFADPQESLNQDPEAMARFGSLTMGGISSLTSALLPNYSPGLVEIAFKDLYNMGIHNTQNMGVTMTRSGILEHRLTNFGDEYLRFITIPLGVE